MSREIDLTRDLSTRELGALGSLLDGARKKEEYALSLKTQKIMEPLVSEAWRSADDQLVAKLIDTNPLQRWLAADVLSRRQVHVEKELIALLKDPYPDVREAAHQALIRLSRGADPGPKQLDTKRNIDSAVERWTHWLALQDAAAARSEPDQPTPPENKK
mgnify:CR=1 FL=1